MMQTCKTVFHYYISLISAMCSIVLWSCDLSSVFRAEIWLWSCSLISCWSSSSLWSFFLLLSSLSISSSASSSCLFSTFSLRVNCKSSVKKAGPFYWGFKYTQCSSYETRCLFFYFSLWSPASSHLTASLLLSYDGFQILRLTRTSSETHEASQLQLSELLLTGECNKLEEKH